MHCCHFTAVYLFFFAEKKHLVKYLDETKLHFDFKDEFHFLKTNVEKCIHRLCYWFQFFKG